MKKMMQLTSSFLLRKSENGGADLLARFPSQ